MEKTVKNSFGGRRLCHIADPLDQPSETIHAMAFSYKEEVGEYKAGSIRKIRLRNFLTYANVEINPGPRLNMVVGPNGTGKSSILCAICLVLGGEPKLLGRSDDARNFIMNDKKEALLEVELVPHADSVTHVLRRVIDRDKGSENGKGRGASTYFINDERVGVNEIKELVRDTYHISIDNLCTFLPQDKVGSFSGFDSKALLVETEKTLSKTQHLYHDHEKLIKAEEDLRGGVNDFSTIEAKLQKLKDENERLEREKERMEEREKAIEQAKLLEKKMLWLKFEKLRESVVHLKDQRARKKAMLREAQAVLQPLQRKLAACQAQKDTLGEQFKAAEQSTQRHRKEMEKQSRKYENHDDGIDGILLELRELDSKKSRNQSKYDKTKERVELLESESSAFPSQEQVNQDLEEAKQERKRVLKEYQRAKRGLETHQDKLKDLQEDANRLQDKLARMEDEKARRNDRIYQQQPNLNKIFRWLEQNRKIFRRRVWGPLVCEVTTKSQNSAAFLEQHVPNAVLKAFIVEDKGDYNKLYEEVRNKLKVPVNVILVANGTLEPLPQRMYSDERMEILKNEHGVIGYMDESFTAPDAIMQALRSNAMVHKVLVGGEATRCSIEKKGLLTYLSEPDRILGQKGYQSSVIFASENNQSAKYTTIVSRYGKKLPSTRQDDNIAPAKWLAPGVNPRTKADLEKKLSCAHEEISRHRPAVDDAGNTVAKLEVEGQSAQLQTQNAQKAKGELDNFRKKLQTARRKMKEAQDALDENDDKEKKKLIKNLMNRVTQSVSALESHADCHDKMMESTYASAGLRISKDICLYTEKRIHRETVERQQEFEELKSDVDRVNAEFTRSRAELQVVKNKAEAEAQLIDSEGNELPLKAELEELPVDTIEEGEAALEEAMAKVNSIIANPDIVRQYEERKIEIERVQAHLEELKGSKDSKELEIEQLKRPWESALVNSITKVNTLFSMYMSELGYTGEVALKKGQAEDGKEGNFREWGIEIRVSFRQNVRAQVLSAHVQSGGERSVSTIMYLMALQEMMVSPFRCVDEINQGLDERNERFVFSRIVQNSTRKPEKSLTDHSGQYFLITPKLLPNLTDMEVEAMTVLFIFNGPYNFESPADWNVDQLTGMRRKRCSNEEEDVEDNEDDENRPSNINMDTIQAPIAKRSRRRSTRL